MKNRARLLLKIILYFFAVLLLYILVVFILSLIPVNSVDRDPASDITIYIKSNGVHTDIVVPLKSEYKDWSAIVKPENTSLEDGYVGFGWGDKDFYLNTPEWSDLKLTTALYAVCYLGSSVMHTSFMTDVSEGATCVRIDISAAEYQKLITYIESGFKFDEKGLPVMIEGAAYGEMDSFYEGNGRYSIVYTCNSWTNEGLKSAGQKAALWTLSDTGILNHYR